MGILMIGGVELPPSFGQMPQLKRPEEAPVEKPAEAPRKKLVNEPRALGLLQLNSSGKGSLIPVAIRIDGKFYDASVYKADPVPMALGGGTVYEVEKDGESQGLFTIRGALHNKNPDSLTPWLGAGTYVANGTEVANTIHKAEDKPRGLDADENDAPPKLKRGKETAESAAPSAGPGAGGGASSGAGGSSNAGGSGGGGSTAGSSAPNGNSGADAGSAKGGTTPTASTQGTAAQGTSTQGTATTQTSVEKPAANQGSAGPSAAGEGSSDKNAKPEGQNAPNYYRPTLRRGKPTQSAPTDAEDDAALATDKLTLPTKGASAGAATQSAVQLVPAISDEGGPQPESFKFFWKEGEEEDRKKQILALAADEVRSYLARQAKDTIPAKPVATKTATSKSGTAAHKSTAKVEPVFENVQFRAFDAWKNNQPVMILTADAHLPAAAGSETPALVYSVTIAARTDIYGDLRKLYSGVTDKFHLDVTPRLDLIDAVDVDGDGRGELLFREMTDAGTGYLIYRPTGDTLWKMFDSLKAE